MESYIKVRTTPNIIGKEFNGYGNIDNCLNIRFMEIIDFKDPEPDLEEEKWLEKYGNDEYIYEVVIRHSETNNYLKENYIYNSLVAVKRALSRMINQYNNKS